MKFVVREILEREIEAEDCVEAQDMYDNEDVVLDYSDLVYSEVVPVLKHQAIILDNKDGSVHVVHYDGPKMPDLNNLYPRFDSNCEWMEMKDGSTIDHSYFD